MKIVIIKSLEDSGLSLKGVRETIQKEIKEQKGGFVSLLLCTLDCSLFENLLTGNGTVRADEDELELAVGLKDL